MLEYRAMDKWLTYLNVFIVECISFGKNSSTLLILRSILELDYIN